MSHQALDSNLSLFSGFTYEHDLHDIFNGLDATFCFVSEIINDYNNGIKKGKGSYMQPMYVREYDFVVNTILIVFSIALLLTN